jgi:uncharacterized membrane protein YdjX (TVP38/TMEM64 family)
MPEAPAAAEPRSGNKARTALGRGALLAAGLLAVAALLHYAPLEQEHALLDAWVVGQGWRGLLLFVLAGGVACGLGVPRQAVSFAAGYVVGAWGGTVLALPAELIGCALNIVWAGSIARNWARRHISGRLGRLGGFLIANPFSATLTLRLLPVGNNLALNLLAGMLGIPAVPFLAASAIGYLPQTVIFALLGSGARVAQGTQIVIGVALFAASALLGLWLVKRVRTID